MYYINMVKLIKLFKINASYSGLVELWDTIAEKFSKIPEVIEYKLAKAALDENEFGYAALSTWTSLEAYRETLVKDVVLKHHFGVNGLPNKNLSSNMYKSIEEKIYNPENDGETDLYICHFERDLFQSNMKHKWNWVIDELNNNELNSTELFKAMHTGSKPEYLFTLITKPGYIRGIINRFEKYHILKSYSKN